MPEEWSLLETKALPTMHREVGPKGKVGLFVFRAVLVPLFILEDTEVAGIS